jgi:spermidine/putrescine transport system substrate-binding protein
MKKSRVFIAVVTLIALLIGMTATVPAQAQDKPTLSLYTWSTYFAENTILDFEEQFGVTVTLDTYASNEELLAKLQAGNPGFDVIIPSDYVIGQMIDGGLLEELNFENIPNFAPNVSEQFKNPPYDPESKHCVAYQW